MVNAVAMIKPFRTTKLPARSRHNRTSEYLPQRRKACPEQGRRGAKVRGRGPSSRADAMELRRISPGVYPEIAEGVEMTTSLSLRAWRLGAINTVHGQNLIFLCQ